jgi:endo-1,4-beta-D-glucanase Y
MTQTPRRHMPAIVLVVAVLATTGLAIGFRATSPSRDETSARTAALSFLARYVDDSGRVVRRDQGGDTVSEGQAYALLLAQFADDPATFERVWHWTRTHLQRRDGLLAYLADAHAVRDRTPATDADLLTAWALLRARGDGAAGYHHDGRRIANAVLAKETARRGGTLMLAAGTWATGNPITLNPSYWAPHVMSQLASITHDRRWDQLARSSVAATNELTAGGKQLPPDWARVDGTAVSATPAPTGNVPQVRYGLEAERLVVWMASSCRVQDRRLAARWWPVLSGRGRAGATALGQQAQVVNLASAPLPYVASAAAAAAAGHYDKRNKLLDRAAEVDAAEPTYYGGAWLALGRALLTTGGLGGCARQGTAA